MNGTLIQRAVVVSLLLAVLVVPRVSAQAARVFLSGTGVDSGDCSDAANPCRSLQYAINQAAPGAEVVIVSSGGYGGANITKSIIVNAPTGVVAFVGRTITVNIASTDTVTLRGLSMNGAVFFDTYGIDFTGGGTLNVENTVISSFVLAGIHDVAAGSKLWVYNCDFKKHNNAGIHVEGAASAVIENSRASGSNDGVFAYSQAIVAVRNSVMQNNHHGFRVSSPSTGTTELIIDSCLLSHNDFGILSSQGGTAVATARVGESVVMSNVTANLSTFGTGQIISQGGNRVGGATGGTTGFTSTEAQQ